MKKFLALFLVIAMFISTLAIFASCDKAGEAATEKEKATETNAENKAPEANSALDLATAKNNPNAVLMSAFSNTSTNFFVVNDSAKTIFKNAANKGAYSLNVSGMQDFGVGDLTATLYADVANKYVAATETMVINGKTISANAYMNPKTVAFSMSGLSKVLKLDLETLSSKFETSAAAKLMGIESADPEMVDMVMEMIEEIKKALNMTQEDATKLANDYLNCLLGEITEENDCIKFPFIFNATTMKQYINKVFETTPYYNNIPGYADAKTEYINQIDQIFNGTELKVNVYVNKSNTSLNNISAKMTLGQAVTGMAGQNIIVTADAVFTADKIAVTGSTTIAEQNYSANIDITKKTEGDVTTFALSAKVNYAAGAASAEIKLAEGTATYNKASGDVALTIKLPSSNLAEGLTATAALNANFKVNGSKATFTATSVALSYLATVYPEYDFDVEFDENYYTEPEPTTEMRNESLSFNIALTVDAAPTIPSMPENATDVMDITTDEWAALENELDKIF